MMTFKALAFVLVGLYNGASAPSLAKTTEIEHSAITLASRSYLNGNLKLTSSQRKELNCYSKVVWYEARGENKRGKILVANVVRNRATYGKPFASSVCEVVYQRNQFAWTRDKKKRNASFKSIAKLNMKTEEKQVMDTLDVAFSMMLLEPTLQTRATHFCSIGERCRFKNVRKLGKVGNHTFFEYLGNA